MKTLLFSIVFSFFVIGVSKAELPVWALKSFKAQKLDLRYKIQSIRAPEYLEEDFNGDGKKDIAVQIIETKTKKMGVLVINAGSNNYYILGAGKKDKEIETDNTNWAKAWKIYRNKFAFKAQVNASGDLMASKKISLKHPAIYVYAIEDGGDAVGAIVYWDGKKYISIHQGD